MATRRVIFKSLAGLTGDVMLGAAIRDLHAANPGQFETDVRTNNLALFESNPLISKLDEEDSSVQTIEIPSLRFQQESDRPFQCILKIARQLQQQLKVSVPLTKYHGDIYLSEEESQLPCPAGIGRRFWIISADSRQESSIRWAPTSYQDIVNHFRGKIHFVQVGDERQQHALLIGVTNLVGKISLRELVRLMHHASGVVCPATLAMHLSAAVPSKSNQPRVRPCVVIAGGNRRSLWQAYPYHQIISTAGALDCCDQRGCAQQHQSANSENDSQENETNCQQMVPVAKNVTIPKCMNMIKSEDAIRRIEWYYEGGVLESSHFRARSGKPILPKPKVNSNAQRKTDEQNHRHSVSFYHGLGDCAYFANLIPMYIRRGHSIEVKCTPEKRILFEAVGATTTENDDDAEADHPWNYPPLGTHDGHGRFWQGSKMGHNISQFPLPDIGDKNLLWQEYADLRIDITPQLPRSAMRKAESWLANLPRPIVLLHSRGDSSQESKSLPDQLATAFYEAFIKRCDGTLILLDWDNRVPRLASYRLRHLDDLGTCSLDVLLALMQQADLLIGVDSGPLHLARLTKVPKIGVWLPGHYPAVYSLPTREQLNVVLTEHTHQWNRFKRIPWNIVEQPGQAFEAAGLADICHRMLSPPRYFGKEDIAADIQMQQFVLDWAQCRESGEFCGHWDRNRSFDVLLREITARFAAPVIVETGTIRSEEAWGGAGFFTYLAGAYLYHHGGKLHSVDIDEAYCRFSREWTAVFGDKVTVHHQDSVGFLSGSKSEIDVLYLDSLDTNEPNHADHAQREVEAALPKLHDRSLIVIDDTPWERGAWIGKGSLAVPWLVHRGWEILYAGYQVILSRTSMQSEPRDVTPFPLAKGE